MKVIRVILAIIFGSILGSLGFLLLLFMGAMLSILILLFASMATVVSIPVCIGLGIMATNELLEGLI